MPLNFISDGTAKEAVLLGTNSDSTDTYMVKGEHTTIAPSTIRFNSTNKDDVRKTHLRQTATRQRMITVNAGTTDEDSLPLTVKLEISSPKGLAATDILAAIHDVVGITNTAEFEDFYKYGVLPSNAS